MPRPTKSTVALLAVLALGLGACGKDAGDDITAGSDDEPPATVAAQTTTGDAEEPTTTAQGCERVSEPEPRTPRERERPKLRLDRDKSYTATLRTTCGSIRIDLASLDSPKTTASFVSLARAGYYDDTIFHRIAPPNAFVIQTGDPTGTGDGGPGYTIVEVPPAGTEYPPGTVAMSKTDDQTAGTSGSQFFIVNVKSDLPREYAVLGRVAEGRDVVSRIGDVPIDAGTDRPIDPIIVKSIDIDSKDR